MSCEGKKFPSYVYVDSKQDRTPLEIAAEQVRIAKRMNDIAKLVTPDAPEVAPDDITWGKGDEQMRNVE